MCNDGSFNALDMLCAKQYRLPFPIISYMNLEHVLSEACRYIKNITFLFSLSRNPGRSAFCLIIYMSLNHSSFPEAEHMIIK